MHRALLAVLMSLLWIPPALAGGLVVWMDPTMPAENAVKKAERRVGTATHLAHIDLAFPPQPASDADAEAYEAIRASVADGKARWDEFDVELDIAREVESAIAAAGLIRDQRDLQDLVDARLFQGAAVAKAFPADLFLQSPEAEPFQVSFPGFVANGPWVQAMALDPEREFTRADVADGSAFPDLQQLQSTLTGERDGALDIRALPEGARLVVDGRELEAGTETIELRPGTHYLHVVRNGVIGGRNSVEVQPAQTATLPLLVSSTDLQTARARVMAGTTTGFPDDVKAGLEALMGYYDGPVFVAARDEGRVWVIPYARGAELLRQKPVTLVGVGEMGGGVVVSPLFDGSEGNNITAPGASGHLGLELGIFNFAITGGCDLAFVPANTVTHANGERTDNVKSSVLPQPWGGLGFYVLRPTGTTPVLLLSGTYGWDYPAHMAFGARVSFGTLIEDEGTWFRLTVGGNTSGSPIAKWQDEGFDQPMHTLFFRIGLGSLFF